MKTPRSRSLGYPLGTGSNSKISTRRSARSIFKKLTRLHPIASSKCSRPFSWSAPASIEHVVQSHAKRARIVEHAIARADRRTIVNGQAADPDYKFEPRVSVGAFFPRPTAAFDRLGASAAKVEHLLLTASQLFNRRGFDGTSLDDITAELGATKGALYHYLDNKTDLVVRCYRRSLALAERFADAAEATGRDGLERGLIGLYLNAQAHATGLSPLTLMVGSRALPAAVRRDITRRARALQQRFEGFSKQGLQEGVFRDIDFNAIAQPPPSSVPAPSNGCPNDFRQTIRARPARSRRKSSHFSSKVFARVEES
jgi:AcrR family transcriptional regulator